MYSDLQLLRVIMNGYMTHVYIVRGATARFRRRACEVGCSCGTHGESERLDCHWSCYVSFNEVYIRVGLVGIGV